MYAWLHNVVRQMMSILAMSVLSIQTIEGCNSEREALFDTDSHQVGIDNRCSYCMSPDPRDCIGPLKDTNREIHGFAGAKVKSVKTGTIRWHWENDEGKVFEFRIPNSFYVPSSHQRLLSPQHLAQELGDTSPIKGTTCTTNSKNMVLRWNQRSQSVHGIMW